MSDQNATAKPWRAEVIADFARSELFQRTFQEGMDLVEVAAACRVSLATIKRRLTRAEARFVELARQEPSLTEWTKEQP